LAGCAALHEPPKEKTTRAGAAYGAFLAAQQAVRSYDRVAASGFYRTALANAPQDEYLIERAFTDELTYGDLGEATKLAEKLVDSPTSDQRRLARVLLASRAVKDGHFQRAVDLLNKEELGPFNRVIGSLVLAWAYDGLGDHDAALKVLSAPGDAPILGHLMTLHRALVLDRAGRTAEAEQAYKEALDAGLMPDLVIDAYGRRLEREGRNDDAKALYSELLAQDPENVPARAGLDRIAVGSKPRAFASTPAQGASMAVFGPAATLASNAPSDIAVIYLRLALYLDPDNGMAREALGGMLMRARLDEDALTVFHGVTQSSAFYVPSKVNEAWMLHSLGRDNDALRTLNSLVAQTKSPIARRGLGDFYRETGRFADALTVYDGLVSDALASGEKIDWRLYYARGDAHQRTDQWDLAEKDFQSALKIAPNEAEILNYLGYSWVDRGERLDEAFDMIRRAVALKPDDGAIVDSLGWAHFKRGEYSVAVQHLERAVELSPQDATINEHLGDAYWRAGRLLEASYQWRRSLTLNPEASTRSSLEDKLANGLPPIEKAARARP
jgi:tetratricopeptide (TPR) repeat protein